ncbi:hypothetical protein DPMN_014905 [Dreissena polymorpha]|uniref:Uncharacterized protein n=1 Tax=Dreissena polymorpha TaxID=45954 RepID=A0A9D4NAL3_DREPO|nr:hypothetical protein DPMN_014905 [Dreissena polymorpha]
MSNNLIFRGVAKDNTTGNVKLLNRDFASTCKTSSRLPVTLWTQLHLRGFIAIPGHLQLGKCETWSSSFKERVMVRTLWRKLD